MLVRTAPSAPAAAGLARRGHSFVLARRPAGRRFWSSAPMDLAVKATGLDQGLPAAHPSRLDPRFVGCCLSLWPVSTLVQWFPEWGRSACRDALAADSRVSCPLAGPWLVSFGARLLSWWLKLSCLDVLGWPRLVLPFDHGVGTPVSSPQSRLSDALRLSLPLLPTIPRLATSSPGLDHIDAGRRLPPPCTRSTCRHRLPPPPKRSPILADERGCDAQQPQRRRDSPARRRSLCRRFDGARGSVDHAGPRRGAARSRGAPATRRSTCSFRRRRRPGACRRRPQRGEELMLLKGRGVVLLMAGFRHGRQGQPGAPPKLVVLRDLQGAANADCGSPACPATCWEWCSRGQGDHSHRHQESAPRRSEVSCLSCKI
ncbi:uncharacterized protein [Lolium perenne]|uniref:uncharacterized protein n=1 Tax=Lolium perenne TaxID=4522 RepID=UPI003A9962D0